MNTIEIICQWISDVNCNHLPVSFTCNDSPAMNYTRKTTNLYDLVHSALCLSAYTSICKASIAVIVDFCLCNINHDVCCKSDSLDKQDKWCKTSEYLVVTTNGQQSHMTMTMPILG